MRIRVALTPLRTGRGDFITYQAYPRPTNDGPGAPRGELPTELLATVRQVLEPHGFVWSSPEPEPESAEYSALALSIGGRAARFRVAKTTPTKAGQFVTLWQRSEAGPIRPFDVSDGVELFLVSVQGGGRRGLFVFPLDELVRRSVVSKGMAGGKRAMRVYPPWVEPASKQAAATQKWQCVHFLELDGDGDSGGGAYRSA